ncbi:MAG: polysaccharide biosynthesis tyrosine autokinase [Alphaproteobacteria bacterium]|nr:polysaccharide biosynthesis tyrosine autokinase [Alphaproteobacteria bacterium]
MDTQSAHLHSGEIAAEERISVGEALRRLYGIYRRRAWTFWIAAAAVTVLGAVWLTQLTPSYTATSTVVLDLRKREIIDLQAVLAGLSPDSATVDTEVGVMRSRSLLSDVAERLSLAETPEFNPDLAEPGAIERAKRAVTGFLRSVLATAGVLGRPERPSPDEAVARERLANRIVDQLRGSLVVKRDGTSFLMTISATSQDPERAAAIANMVADRYLVQQLEAKFDATKRANTWLSDRLAELRGQVETAEAAVESFRTEAGLLSAEGSTLTEAQLVDLNSQLTAAKAALAERNARLTAVRQRMRQGGSPDTIAEVLTSDVIQQLRGQLAEVGRKRAELEGTLGPKHPDLQRVNREMDDLNGQIRAEINRIVANLENEVAVARERVTSLTASQEQAQTRLVENNNSLVRLRELERNAESLRSLYESFLSRFHQTSEQEGLVQSDAQIVSRAVVPNAPSAPRTKLLLLAIVVAGLGAGAGLAALLEILDLGYSLPEEIERRTSAPVLGLVPALRDEDRTVNGSILSPIDYLIARPFSTYSEAFRAIKASLFLSNVERRPQLLQITSSIPGEGKTASTIALGRTLARAGMRVVVVDADLRRRDLTQRLAITTKTGLLEVMAGREPLASALVVDSATKMSVLPLSDSTYLPSDVFASGQFADLIAELERTFDVILLDSAPVFAVADALVLAQHADAVLLVVQWRATARTVVQTALNELQKVHAKIGGIVLNRTDMRAITRYSSGHVHYKTYSQYYHN